VTRRYRMNRQSGAPLEGRAVLAYRDHRLDEIVIYASTQTPHMVRVAIAENLGIDERCVRVVAPDVGAALARRRGSTPRKSFLPRLR
jgi:carbon-monoxide dehydrogenase large subunit